MYVVVDGVGGVATCLHIPSTNNFNVTSYAFIRSFIGSGVVVVDESSPGFNDTFLALVLM